jgi:hypothetical protein
MMMPCVMAGVKSHPIRIALFKPGSLVFNVYAGRQCLNPKQTLQIIVANNANPSFY